ncbi:MAG: AMP-binding protein [Parvibaculum sp.]|nr:AMP-binding protein [Parvibaculum sp.]
MIFAPLGLKPPATSIERHADGSLVLSSDLAPLKPSATLIELFEAAEAAAPEAPFLSEPSPSGWSTISYGDFMRASRALAVWLLGRPEGRSGRPLAILSGNSVHHAIATIGACMIGKPVAPVSPAYSLMSKDFERLGTVLAIARPDLFFVEDLVPFETALKALGVSGEKVVGRLNAQAENDISIICAANSGIALDLDRPAIGPDTIAKLMFTSGSTGVPKCSVQSHRMLCHQIAATEALEIHDTRGDGTVLLDWLPWSHIAGGNMCMNRVVYRRGHLHIDAGRPFPGMYHHTIEALKHVRPTEFMSTPVGFQMLAQALETEDGLAAAFFSRIRSMSSGGAALAADTFERIQTAAGRARGCKIPFTTVYGATEVQSVAMVHWLSDATGAIGGPLPGVQLRLRPVAGKYALDVKAQTVSPGYIGPEGNIVPVPMPDGYFETGDAARLADPEHPELGLVFDGRLAENFKLRTGTWVDVAAVRKGILDAAGGLLSDCVVCGVNEDFVGVLGFPGASASPEGLADLGARIESYNGSAGGSSNRVARFLMLTSPPAFDAQEVTDKGYINQQRVRECRADQVQRLFAAAPDAEIVCIEQPVAAAQ